MARTCVCTYRDTAFDFDTRFDICDSMRFTIRWRIVTALIYIYLFGLKSKQKKKMIILYVICLQNDQNKLLLGHMPWCAGSIDVCLWCTLQGGLLIPYLHRSRLPILTESILVLAGGRSCGCDSIPIYSSQIPLSR